MNSVGIDVSKGKSMVAVVRPMKTVVAKPFEVHHTVGGLSRLADYIKGLDGDTRVIMENTGRYYEPMAQKLYEAGIFVECGQSAADSGIWEQLLAQSQNGQGGFSENCPLWP